jgi:hypothetical protein
MFLIHRYSNVPTLGNLQDLQEEGFEQLEQQGK